jgi:hypothetical protein
MRAASESLVHGPTAAATRTVLNPSLVRRAFLPSPLEELPGPRRVDALARLRALFTLTAIVFDIGIFVALRRSAHFDDRALTWFVGLNVPLLLVSVALNWTLLRRRRRGYTTAFACVVALEMFTSMVWIHLTGSVSSYFLIVVPVLVLSYRLFASYGLGLATYAMGAAMHLGVVALELSGVIGTAPLFASDPGPVYAEPAFRVAAAASIQMLFVVMFILANVVARALREKETELDAAQRELDRAVAEVQPGRLSGKVLSARYRLGELLGRGGMGEVYEAHPVAGGEPVAIKVLYGHLCDPDELERFRREAAIAAKLPAEYVAQVHELGLDPEGGHHYLVMERLRGEDLGTLLRRRAQLPSAELLPIVEQLAAALDAAHAVGVVHRDLKPQNVFLLADSDPPRIKLLDFGVARFSDGSQLTQSSMLIGSPGYLAPEQAVTHFGQVGPRTDVFALGSLVYRAITGHPAFPARNAALAVYEAVYRDPPRPSEHEPALPVDVDDVIALALAKDPRQRYASPGELARDLRAAFACELPPDVRDRARAVAAWAADRGEAGVRVPGRDGCS